MGWSGNHAQAMKHVVYVSLGSNISPRLRYLRSGLQSLRQEGITLEKVSSFYRTTPVGIIDQPYFFNAVAKARTALKPIELLKLFKKIEKKWGREKTIRFGPRTLDIDLLLYDNLELKTRTLTLPHPRMFSRRFVLVPLLEISPSLKTPRGISFRSFVACVETGQQVTLYPKARLFRV